MAIDFQPNKPADYKPDFDETPPPIAPEPVEPEPPVFVPEQLAYLAPINLAASLKFCRSPEGQQPLNPEDLADLVDITTQTANTFLTDRQPLAANQTAFHVAFLEKQLSLEQLKPTEDQQIALDLSRIVLKNDMVAQDLYDLYRDTLTPSPSRLPQRDRVI